MERIAIKMLASARGSDRDSGGCAEPVKVYHKGQTYEVAEILAKCFVESGRAEVLKNKGAADEATSPTGLDLKNMRVEDLRKMAEDYEIPLGKDAKKAEIIKALEKAFMAELEG